MPPSPEHLRGADLLRHRCMYGSKLMSSEEIDNILRIQYKSLNSGVPYNEDYYFLVGAKLAIHLFCNAPVILSRMCQHLHQNRCQYQKISVRAVCCPGSMLHHMALRKP